jgi:hypothetical protein
MMTSRSLICLLENQNGGKLQKTLLHLSNNANVKFVVYCNSFVVTQLIY